MPYDPSAARSGAIFSSNPAYQGAWICYINGVEVPIVGFEVGSGVWQVPDFTIHLVPDPLLSRLGHEDRVPVQIFYLDYWYEPESPRFRLLIDGEIIGFSYNNYAGQRTMSFSGLAHIHVFQQLYFFYMTNVDDIVAAQSPTVSSSGFTQAGLLYPYSLFHQGLLVTREQVQNASAQPGAAAATPAANADASDDAATAMIKTPYELVYNVIKGVIGTTVPAERRAVPMMNFFARHIRKTRLHNRFVRMPILEDPDKLVAEEGVFPIFKAARSTEAINAMQRQTVAQIGNSGPVWNMFQQILSMVYMEIGMVPNPAAVIVALQPAQGVTIPTDGTVPTAFNEPQDGKIIGLLSADRSQDMTITGDDATVGAPPDEQNVAVTATTPIRLAQYFVKPQFLFGIPPHCNVLFPSMVKGWTYDENYIKQATRVYVNDSVMTQLLRAPQGAARELMLHALTVAYPEEADAILQHKHGSTTEANSTAHSANAESGRNLLIWPEEYYKGPVTDKIQLPQWFQMLRQFTNASRAADEPIRTIAGANDDVLRASPVTTESTPGNAGTGSAGAVEAEPVSYRDRPTYAYRRQIGRRTVVSINGVAPERFWLGSGTGLDPAKYLEPQFTQLWPTRRRSSSARRGRDEPQVNLSLAQKQTITYRYYLRAVDQMFADRSVQERAAIAMAAFFTSIIEGAMLSSLRNWNFGNVKKYRNYDENTYWTIGPDRQPYCAARTVDEGIRLHLNTLFHPEIIQGSPTLYQFARRVLYDQVPANHPFYAVPRVAEMKRRNAAFWNARGGYRPDLYYAALGWDGYFAGDTPEYRAKTGADRCINENITRMFERVTTLSVPEVAPETLRPLLDPNRRPLATPADLAFARQNQSVAFRTVSRPVARVARRGETALPESAPGSPAMRTTSAATAPQGTNGAIVADQEGQSEALEFTNIFRLYAQYEYLKQRYSNRRASANLAFNPYLVAGFPGMLFDSMRTRMHIVGYIAQVRHTGSAQGDLSTSVAFDCCRTLPEFINDVRNDAERFSGRVTAAPAEIISEIREVIQDEANAEALYRRLFYGNGPRPGNAPVAFRWTDAVGYSDRAGVIGVQIIGQTVAEQETLQRAVARAARASDSDADAQNGQPSPSGTTEQYQTVHSNLDPNRELSPTEGAYEEAFDSYDAAMRLASRPCCSLEDFVRFWHGGRLLGDLEQSGEVGDEIYEFAYNTVTQTDAVSVENSQLSRPTALFFSRIFKLRAGPGTGDNLLDGPTDAQRGYTEGPNVHPVAPVEGLPSNYPETRADWDKILLQYREKIRNLLRPST